MDERRADAGELAEGHPHLIDDLRAVGSEPASAARRVGPPRRDLGGQVGECGDVQDHRRRPGLADDARRNRPGQGRLAGVPAELGAEQVDDAGGLGRGQHVDGFGRIAGERLLAQHVPPASDGRERQLGVRVRRRRDGDGVDAGQLECRGERGARLCHTEASGAFRGARRITPDVGDAAEPRADHDGTDRPRALSHRWKPSSARQPLSGWRRAPPSWPPRPRRWAVRDPRRRRGRG